MEYRVFDDTYGTDNVEAELEHLIDSGDPDALVAAATFFLAMDKMRVDGRCYASAVPSILAAGLFFAPHASVRVRHSRGHHLYLTFIARPIVSKGEVRILKAHPDATPTAQRTSECETRHNLMTTMLTSGAAHGNQPSP